MRSKRVSLFSQLVAIGAAVIVIATMAGIGVTQMVARTEYARIHDEGLVEVASLLLGLLNHELGELPIDASIEARVAMGRADSAETFGNKYRYQIWTAQGKFLLGHHGLPGETPLGQPGMKGFHSLDMDGSGWRLLVLHDKTAKLEIRIAEIASARDWVVSEYGAIIVVLLLSMLLVMLAALWALSLALHPLSELAHNLQSRSAGDLGDVQLSRELTELVPVTAALNRLFARVGDASRRESAFHALAAHEMRTPLATMRIVAENAIHSRDSEEHAAALRDLITSVDKCSHLQDQLLTLARLESTEPETLNQQIDLVGALDDAVAAVAVEARDRHMHIAVHADTSVITGHRLGVLNLIKNLLSNAVRYAPERGLVELSSFRQAGAAVIRVDDNGPGIPEHLQQRALERFERLHQQSGPGVGLGLSIVHTVVQMHDADLTMSRSPLGGLRVEVTFAGRTVTFPDEEPDDDLESVTAPEPIHTAHLSDQAP